MPDVREHTHGAAARLCIAITDSIGRDVTNDLGVAIAQEVDRALLSLTEALAGIYRDTLLELGYSPNDPRLQRPESS